MDSWSEFTLAEIMEMETMYKDAGKECLNHHICYALASNFTFSASRAGSKRQVTWQQVYSWFHDKLVETGAEFNPSEAIDDEKLYIDYFGGSIPGNEPDTSQKHKATNIKELKDLQFEALSSRDHAWYDVSSFLTYRVLHNGDLEARVRFSGFSNTDDEWVNVRYGIRERSIPLEPSECHKVNVGDLVLCFQEREDQAVYCNARILDVRREEHDSSECSCAFLVRYDRNGIEEEVGLGRICCRPS